jgi:hypothetical protein
MEAILARLIARVNAYLHGEDADELLSERTLSDIAELTNGGKAESLDLKAVYATALAHWHRYHAAGDDEGNDDLAAAVRFFAPLLATRPYLVPQQLHQRLTSENPKIRPVRDHRIWAQRAEGLLDRTVRSGEHACSGRGHTGR